ncbi:MAG: aspartate kinase [Paludibacteraceae bacterium]|nr:aspartate kinase [Paludibacteraceae bacterium]
MKIYKFGGAAVKNAECIRHLSSIISDEEDDLMIVVSAMGKTTNQLEEFTRMLYPDAPFEDAQYNQLYDQVVSTGELQSTRIVSAYLNHVGLTNHWMDITTVLRTDNAFRCANVDIQTSTSLLRAYLANHPAHIYVTQGFIGGTSDGLRTTLGREGSDYTAGLLAYMLDATSVTLWKDVPGVFSADPRKVKDAHLIHEMSYQEAAQLVEQGAQIVHHKTFKPLMDKHIPLIVKPFMHPEEQGTLIH